MTGDRATRPDGGRARSSDAPDGAPRGLRIVLDARPLQDSSRSPTTAVYLEALLEAFDADPIPGESFAFLLQSDLDDPTVRFQRLEVVGRRLLPPTRWLGAAAMTLDPFLVRGASIGAAWRAAEGGAGGAVYHAAGGAVPVPLLPETATVVTLLDLAPWELESFQRGSLARIGQRLRGGLIRHAGAVIVASNEVAVGARRALRIPRARLHVVPLAARHAFRVAPSADQLAAARAHAGLPERYLVYGGRFDARHDVATLVAALAELARAGRPASLPEPMPWPPRVLLVGGSPDDRASIARLAARVGVGAAFAWAPTLDDAGVAVLVAGARAVLLPVVSDSAGLPAIEALAAGTPVIAASVGALPAIVARAGMLVEPGHPNRLARALSTIWADDGVHERLAVEARERAFRDRRTWRDVADDTRRVYAAAAGVR